MSFSSDVKTALCDIENESPCCDQAELYGLLLFARHFSGSGVEVATGSEYIAQLISRLCERVAGVIPSVTKSSAGNCSVKISKRSDIAAVLELFGHSIKDVSFTVNYANIENDCCIQSFLRGAFLSCGRVTDPAKSYHLEFSVTRLRAANAFEKMLQNHGYPPLTAYRGNSRVLYFKDSEQIEELLTNFGAIGGALDVINAKVYKDVRNRENRLTNCEAANIGKTVHAAQIQLRAIEGLRKAPGGLRALPRELREICTIRMLNPNASLSEIGAMLNPPISRSGVNHRLSKVIELAKEINSKNEKKG